MDDKYQILKDICILRQTFGEELSKNLKLIPTPAPLFVDKQSGLNDNLNGVERPVQFMTKGGEDLEVIHSLAKWKRYALYKFGIESGHGIVTDMRAIRRDEDLDAIHSYYVDQWDWEKVISKEQRSLAFLKETVTEIFQALKTTEDILLKKVPNLSRKLPDEISFITTQELEDRYPNLTPKERENIIAKEKKAVFIIGIGKKLKSGNRHDLRAPDYDDWELNGDILVYDPVLDSSLELSSMGIRVDDESLKRQLKECNCLERLELPFHEKIIKKQLPYSIGGGIGQSRLCMFMLEKQHIAEVQPSTWKPISKQLNEISFLI